MSKEECKCEIIQDMADDFHVMVENNRDKMTPAEFAFNQFGFVIDLLIGLNSETEKEQVQKLFDGAYQWILDTHEWRKEQP